MTPNEYFIFVVGKLIKEKGGETFIETVCKEYTNGLDRERIDRSRIKTMLLKALKKANETE